MKVEEKLPNGNILCWDDESPHGYFWRNKYFASMGWCPHDKTPLETKVKGLIFKEKTKVCPKCGAKFDKVGVEIFE